MITKKQAIDRYGSTLLKLNYYHNYTFSFVGFARDGAKIYFTYGGKNTDISRYTIDMQNPKRFSDVVDTGRAVVMKRDKIIFESDGIIV